MCLLFKRGARLLWLWLFAELIRNSTGCDGTEVVLRAPVEAEGRLRELERESDALPLIWDSESGSGETMLLSLRRYS